MLLEDFKELFQVTEKMIYVNFHKFYIPRFCENLKPYFLQCFIVHLLFIIQTK